MLNVNNYQQVQSSVTGNIGKYMPMMIQFKSTIQRRIIPLLSQQEKTDIQSCHLNVTTINQLANLGKIAFQESNEKSAAVLYCICMAIGTIIKEYGWGIVYVQQDGICEMAVKIIS